MKIFIMTFIVVLSAQLLKAQIPVTDGANITQSIVNSVQQLVQTSTTAENMINNFKETVKIFEQGKQYYDALRAVSNLVKDARKVQKIILLVGEISEIYVKNYQLMLVDKTFSFEELTAISNGYVMLMTEATDALLELKNVVNITGMSMTDKDRLDEIDRVYKVVKHFRDLASYYTRKTMSVAYLRAQQRNGMERFMSLYGKPEDRYW